MERGDHTAPEHGPNGEDRHRVTVAEAAELLGITAEAVRTRIKRGKLDAVKEDGTVYVLLPLDLTGPNADPTSQGRDQTRDQTATAARVEELRERVRYLERQVEEEREARRRADTILAQLSQANAEQARTIRAIEAPASSREEAPESSEPRPGTPTPTEAAPEAQGATERPEERSWWRRVFGG